jgi:ATP-dependent Clp protease ATP-binding subunit ClpA
MFERFTPEARQIVVVAREEAQLMHHGHLGTEHLLVALADEDEVRALGLERERARSEVVRTVGLGDVEPQDNTWVPFTAAAKEALEEALGEAMRMGHTQIDPGHLLLAVLKQRDGVARRILVTAGATPSELRESILRRLRELPRGAAPPGHIETPGSAHEAVTTALGRALLGDFGHPDVDARLLISIVRAGGPVGRFLQERGLSEDYLRTRF